MIRNTDLCLWTDKTRQDDSDKCKKCVILQQQPDILNENVFQNYTSAWIQCFSVNHKCNCSSLSVTFLFIYALWLWWAMSPIPPTQFQPCSHFHVINFKTSNISLINIKPQKAYRTQDLYQACWLQYILVAKVIILTYSQKTGLTKLGKSMTGVHSSSIQFLNLAQNIIFLLIFKPIRNGETNPWFHAYVQDGIYLSQCPEHGEPLYYARLDKLDVQHGADCILVFPAAIDHWTLSKEKNGMPSLKSFDAWST